MKKWQWALIGLVIVATAGAAAFLSLPGQGKSAATVNGVAVKQADVDKEIAKYNQQPNALKGAEGKKQEARLREAALDYLITAELIRQEAKKQGLKVSDKAVDTKLAQVKKIFPDPKQYQETLKQQGLTEADLRQKVYEQLVTEKMVAKVTAGVKVSEKDLKEYYEKNKSQIMKPEQKRWRHILVKDRKKADGLLVQLKGGADFAKLAKANSIDQATKDQGGDLGLRPETELSPDVAQAVKPLKLNQLSGVIKAADGYHIYQLREVKPAQQQPFEEVKGQIKQVLTREEQRAKFTAWLEKLKKNADINKFGAK